MIKLPKINVKRAPRLSTKSSKPNAFCTRERGSGDLGGSPPEVVKPREGRGRGESSSRSPNYSRRGKTVVKRKKVEDMQGGKGGA